MGAGLTLTSRPPGAAFTTRVRLRIMNRPTGFRSLVKSDR
jgi:hypothetical protein